MTEKPKLRIHDDPAVREQFFEKFIAAKATPAGAHILLGNMRFVPDKTGTPQGPHELSEVYVTGRLVLSPDAVIEMLHTLNGLLQTMTKPQGPAN